MISKPMSPAKDFIVAICSGVKADLHNNKVPTSVDSRSSDCVLFVFKIMMCLSQSDTPDCFMASTASAVSRKNSVGGLRHQRLQLMTPSGRNFCRNNFQASVV